MLIVRKAEPDDGAEAETPQGSEILNSRRGRKYEEESEKIGAKCRQENSVFSEIKGCLCVKMCVYIFKSQLYLVALR